MSLVNVSLKFWSLNIIKYGIYANIFAEKMWEAFAFAKATHIFQQKNCELDIVLTRTVNILTTNELVKLTMLWTTGPYFFVVVFSTKNCWYFFSTKNMLGVLVKGLLMSTTTYFFMENKNSTLVTLRFIWSYVHNWITCPSMSGYA